MPDARSVDLKAFLAAQRIPAILPSVSTLPRKEEEDSLGESFLHTSILSSESPVSDSLYRISLDVKKTLKGVVDPTGAYIHLEPQKDGSLRLCID